MRRLAVIGTARLDPIVRPDRDVDRIGLVAVVVAEQQDERAVLVRTPALERWKDRLTGGAERLERQRLTCLR